MTLSTHAVAGAAIAAATPAAPVAGLIIALLSHFFLDAIPHWDYKLGSRQYNPVNILAEDMIIGRAFVFDLAKITLDVIIGFALVGWFMASNYAGPVWLPWVGAAFAMLPDALQFVYWKVRGPIFTPLQRFHLWIHADRKLPLWPGLPLQILIIALVLLV